MTKPRPWWSKALRQAAALACGLVLLHDPSPVWAAGKKSSARPAASRTAKKLAKARVAPAPAEAFGVVDIIDDGQPGLHGKASFYGKGFQGRKTSTGERFDARQFTAASNHFPLGALVAVRRVDNDRCAIVKVNDRMHGRHANRVIDVSHGVADYLGMLRAGVVFVRVVALKKGGADAGDSACQAAFAPDDACRTCPGEQASWPQIPG